MDSVSGSRIAEMQGNIALSHIARRDIQNRKLRRLNRELTKKISNLEDTVRTYREMYIRQIAEMDNFMKAKEREMENISRNASRELIKQMLPFVDSMDAAIKTENSDGIRTLKDQLLKILSPYGFKEIETIGRKFDPYLHEARGMVESDEDGLVLEEMQKGYTLNGEVLRTSKVIVGKGRK